MRGSPILRALIALAILLALAWPLHRLLQAHESDGSGTARPASTVEAARPVHLQLSFTETPVALRVLSLGAKVWEETNPAAEMERDLKIAFPKEGVDLQFEVDWPEGVKAAAKVVLTDPEGAEHAGYVWGNGKTVEVLTFQ